jgi:exosortase
MATTTAVAPDPAGEMPASLIQMIRAALRDARSRLTLFGAIAGSAMLALIYARNLQYLVYTWSTDANYSHGFLVPLISLYFANEAARLGRLPVVGGVRIGIALLIASILGRLATILVPIGILGDLSFLLGLAGIVALLGGTGVLRRYGFALFFLVFMVPLPIALYTKIANPLQLLVSQVASTALNAIGIPVLCEGNMMTLPGGVRMFVAEACSGMRQLTGFLALTTAVAFVVPRPWWYRAIVIGSSIPIAMTANVVRVMLTGIIMFRVDPQYASGSWHAVEGLLMMGLGLAILAAFCSLLNGLSPHPPTAAEPSRPPRPPLAVAATSRSAAGRVALASLLLAFGLVAQAGVEQASNLPRPPLRRELATLPLRLGDWVGRDVPVDPEVLERSQADDYLNRVYENPRFPDRALTLWVNYSRHGLNLRHSPEVCLPSGGWEKVESATEIQAFVRPGRPDTTITKLAYRRGELAQGVAFWYYIFGEGRVEQLVRRLPITSRSSHGRTTRGSGMTVEVFSPYDPDSQALRDFAPRLLDALEPILPAERASYFRP